MMTRQTFLLTLGIGFCLAISLQALAEPVPYRMTAANEVRVVVADSASPRVREAANTLADYLGQITGDDYEVVTGEGSAGIVVGLGSDFVLPGMGVPVEPVALEREVYLLRSEQDRLLVIGATELAVEHAVWDLLHRVGYRHFFPGDAWEVIPRQPDLSIAVDDLETPDYLHRNIFYGYGQWMRQGPDFKQWAIRNRVSVDDRSSIKLRTAHVYAGIVQQHEDVFEANPDWLALVNGERRRLKNSQKFSTANPELRKFLADLAVQQIADNPELDSISRDPSDLGNWCESIESEELGTITDQAVTLANDAAQAITARFGDGKYVGMYAYAQHAPPPTIQVHPNVVVSIATALTTGGYTVDELIDGWSRKASILGIREYWSVYAWDRSLPGRGRGASPSYVAESIARFHARGARFMTAEASESWGPQGLSYYLASRLMWDTDKAEQLDTLVEDFLTRAFGPAAEPMRSFYELLDAQNTLRLSDHKVGSMYRLLHEARQIASGDEAIRLRLDQLALYTRYVELYREYANAQGDQRQAAFEDLLRFVSRIRHIGVVDAVAVWRDLDRRDRAVAIPDHAAFKLRSEENPWKSDEPIKSDEIDDIIERGIEANPLLPFDFAPVAFSEDLVPATWMSLETLSFEDLSQVSPIRQVASRIGSSQRGRKEYYLWLDEPGEIRLQVTGGLIEKYRDRGNVKFHLFSDQEPSTDAVSSDMSTPPDGQAYEVVLTTPYTGLHTLVVNDGHDMTRLEFPENVRLTAKGDHSQGRWHLYFYVPKGTRHIIGLANHLSGELLNAKGESAFDFVKQMEKPGYFRVPVPEGQDGKLWKFSMTLGHRELLNVPPYFASSGDQLLLPREVVEADQ